MLKRLLPFIALLVTASAFAVDVTTYHNDNARTGQNLSETILTPANVNVTGFGKLFVLSVDGKVDAEPLYLAAVTFPGQGTHNALYVVTEHDSVYAFDADTGAQLWKVSMLKAGETPSDSRGCSQVTPEIGITSTPVISRSNGTIYLVAMSKDTSSAYFHRLHALDLTTGAEKSGGPIDIQAVFPGTGDSSNGTNVVFDPKQYEERAALLLLNGVVYTSWTSHCDIGLYTGWVIGYSATTLARTSVFNFTPNGHMGSVWMAGSGPAADPNGNIYFLASNGTFDTTLDANGFPNRGNFGNAFIKLSTINNSLAAADYFNMFNTVSESNADLDLGSGGALVLPDMTDASGTTRHLAVGAGKDQHIYLTTWGSSAQRQTITIRICLAFWAVRYFPSRLTLMVASTTAPWPSPFRRSSSRMPDS
jgi:outer membrane protein assembly factor BamB